MGVTELRFKKEARAITETFIIKMPEYIDRLEEFQLNHPLPMQKTRVKSYTSFASRVNNMFRREL